MKKLICVLCLIILLCACGPEVRDYEIIKTDGTIDHIKATNVIIQEDGSLHLRVFDYPNWYSVAIYPANTYKNCVTTE